MKRRLKIYFDGGSRPNPGPMEVALVARGQTYYFDDLGSGTNTEAEWTALLKSAELARDLATGPVELIGDSRGVIGQASGTTKCRGDRATELRAAFLDITAALPELRLRWSPRNQNLAGIALEARRQLSGMNVSSKRTSK